MTGELLAQIWAVLLLVLLAGYAILDGFDLGVGILHRFVPRSNTEKRILMNAIGPLWDGNEVWLVTFGGALFAAFPEAYATVFSGFYTPVMVLLFALILRAVSLEFRGKVQSESWRGVWDLGFFGSSLVATLVFGVAVGNTVLGIPLDARGDFTGSPTTLLNGYSLLVGLFTVSLFAMHGAVFLHLKTEGDLQRRVRGWFWRCFVAFVLLYLTVSLFTLLRVPSATANFRDYPVLWIMPVLNALAIANVPREMSRGRPLAAFASSSASIAALVFLLGVAVFPNLVTSNPHIEHSLTIFRAASSPKTLRIMLIIAAIGMPFVVVYTSIIYWTYRGKVRLSEDAY
jgi:cytochrome d ubiquinol oxidase subunit II